MDASDNFNGRRLLYGVGNLLLTGTEVNCWWRQSCYLHLYGEGMDGGKYSDTLIRVGKMLSECWITWMLAIVYVCRTFQLANVSEIWRQRVLGSNAVIRVRVRIDESVCVWETGNWHCCCLLLRFAADRNWVVDCYLSFTLCGFVSSVLHSHSGIWKRQVASFIFGGVLHLKMKGEEGKSRGKLTWMCMWVRLRVGNQMVGDVEIARRWFWRRKGVKKREQKWRLVGDSCLLNVLSGGIGWQSRVNFCFEKFESAGEWICAEGSEK